MGMALGSPRLRSHGVCALRSRLRSAVPFAFIGNTEKQKYVFKRKMLTELEEVKHAMFAHDGGMGGNGTWLSPFAFSWRLRAAVPFALCGPICVHWEHRKTKIFFQKERC